MLIKNEKNEKTKKNMISSPWLAEMNIGQGLLHIKILLKNVQSAKVVGQLL
jgi:hypothetical protein